MSRKFQILQLNLSGSLKREDNLKSELKEYLEAEECALHKLDSSNARLHEFHTVQTEGLKESLKEAEEKNGYAEHRELHPYYMKIASSLEEQGNEYRLQTKTCGCYFYCSDNNRLVARAEEAESKHKTLEESKKKLQDELKNFRATCVTLGKFSIS